MILTVECIAKRKYRNKITHYVLRDEQGQIMEVKADKLKDSMINNRINVVNLKLTSDKRIIGTTVKDKVVGTNVTYIDRDFIKRINCNRKLVFQSNMDIKSLESKAQILGINVIRTTKSLYTLEKEDSIIVVSDKQISLPDTCERLFASTDFSYISLINLASDEVRNTRYMFNFCKASKINLACLDTSRVRDMTGMFADCSAEELDLSNLDTSNTINMNSMFFRCKSKRINLKGLNTKKVNTMNQMFYHTNFEELDLSSFNTHNVVDMSAMFSVCTCPKIDISSFDTSNVKDMTNMLSYCKTNILDLSNFNVNKVNKFDLMFSYCEANEIDISSLDIDLASDVVTIFNGCKAKVVKVSKKNIYKLPLNNLDNSSKIVIK